MNPFLHRALVFPLIERLRGEPITRSLRELNASQWYSRDRLRAMQWDKLKRLLDHCYRNVPFYRKRFDALQVRPEEIRGFEDFARLPPLLKDDVRSQQQGLRDPARRRRVEECRSGGTLGEPLALVRDMRASAYARAAELRAFGWFGIRKGDRQVRIWGVPLGADAARRERRKDRILNRIRLSPFEISPETVRAFHAAIRRFGARYAYTYPSAAYRICQVLEQEGLDGRQLPLEFVVCSAETLYEHQRSTIQQALDCRVIDEYGCSEMGPIAIECPAGNRHLTMENILAEFVDDGSGTGRTEILLTNLNSYAMPFLRYHIGDTGTPMDAECSCGRPLQLMEFGAGRVLSMLRATDGRWVSGTVFCYIAFDIIKRYGGIKDFRVVQRTHDRLEITLVRAADYGDETLERFRAHVRDKFGADMELDFRFVEAIPLEKSGKRLFVYSELDPA